MIKLRKSQTNVAKAEAIDAIVSVIEDKIDWLERDLQGDLDYVDEKREECRAECAANGEQFSEDSFQSGISWRLQGIEITRVKIATMRKIIDDLCK